MRRFLLVLDESVLQRALTVWAEAHAARVAATIKGLRHFAVDGKSLRGAAGKGCAKPHVLGVLDVSATVFLTQAAALPWNQIPDADIDITPRLHGRVEKRVVKVTGIGRHDEAIAFAHARQAAQVTRYEQRRTRIQGRWYWKKIEVAYYLCTWDQIRLPAAQLARTVKNHWMVEVWHWLRDVTLQTRL